jgi:hypothetical protein
MIQQAHITATKRCNTPSDCESVSLCSYEEQQMVFQAIAMLKSQAACESGWNPEICIGERIEKSWIRFSLGTARSRPLKLQEFRESFCNPYAFVNVPIRLMGWVEELLFAIRATRSWYRGDVMNVQMRRMNGEIASVVVVEMDGIN